MALFRVAKYTRISSGSPSQDWVIVYWNDSTNDFEVYWHDQADEAGTSVQLGGSSNDRLDGVLLNTSLSSFFGQVPTIEDGSTTNYNYAYCDSTTRVDFQLSDFAPVGSGLISSIFLVYDYPFAKMVFTPDSPSCSVTPIICDLTIDDSSITVLPESDPDSSSRDAEVTMTCETSNGPVQWSLAGGVTTYDSDSSSGDRYTIQWHNKFPLSNDIYNFAVKDSNNCIASKTINVGSYANPVDEFGVRWRLDNWLDLDGTPVRLDILRRNYSGSIDEVKGGDEPFQVSYRGESEIKHYSILATEVDVSLISETDMQFSELFEADEKSYLAKIYKDYGSGYVLYWQGFLLTDLYQEPFVSAPYPVSMKFSDGLGTLKNVRFTDLSDNNFDTRITVLQGITTIIKKTQVELNLRVGVNIYATGMDTTDDDCPLAQCKFDPTIYYDSDGTPANCDFVLANLLKPFGARILQAGGYWNIERVKEKYGTIDYREFDLLMNYIGNGSFGGDVNNDDSMQTSRIVQTDNSAILSFVPGYGRITLTNKLSLVNNLLKNGGFEKDLDRWTVNYINGGGVSGGVEETGNPDTSNPSGGSGSNPDQFK